MPVVKEIPVKEVDAFVPIHWEQQGNSFTADEVINAYNKGKIAGENAQENDRIKEFTQKIKLSTSIAEEFLESAKSQNIPLKEIYLKARSINDFEVLFIVENNEAFIAPEFAKAYNLTWVFEEKYNTDSFYVSFSFVPHGENLDYENIVADRFFLKYEKRKEASARSA
jgi:hypothetical protein